MVYADLSVEIALLPSKTKDLGGGKSPCFVVRGHGCAWLQKKYFMLKGSLGQISIVEVIRLLSSSNQTGQLHLMNMTDAVATGGCYFQMGKWVHASMGRFSGLDAIKEICRMSEGSFAFEVGVASPEQTLVQYPTATLVEMVREQVEEFQALRKAAPDGQDFPRYIPGKAVDGLEATPEELSMLLHCSGEKTVSEIARQTGIDVADMRRILGKFHFLGLVEIVPGSKTPAPSAPPSSDPAAGIPVEEAPSEAKPVRYWRGKPVYE